MSLTPANIDFDFEYSTPQSPLTTPTQHADEQSPATTKRKHNGNGDTVGDYNTQKRRTSPLQQVATPETIDLTSDEACLGHSASGQTQNLTPMKRSVSSSQQKTPTTIVKGVRGFQIDSYSSSGGIGLLDPFNISSNTASPLSDKSSMLGPTASTQDDNHQFSATDSDAMPIAHKTPNIIWKSQSSTSQSIPTNQARTSSNTAPTTPQKPLSALQKIPAVAPVYVPVYISPDSPVKLRDSKDFCIYPPFWKRWPREQYEALARYLQENVNLVPFAEQENLTVEEVQHVYHAVVTEPLLDETEKLCAAGQKRIETMFKTFDKSVGLSWRKWGDEESNVDAKLGGVRPGIVQLIGKNADLIEVPYRKLNKADKEHVLSLVRDEEREVLMRKAV